MGRKRKLQVGWYARSPLGRVVIVGYKDGVYQCLLRTVRWAGTIVTYRPQDLTPMRSRPRDWGQIAKVIAYNESIEDRGCDCHCCPHWKETIE